MWPRRRRLHLPFPRLFSSRDLSPPPLTVPPPTPDEAYRYYLTQVFTITSRKEVTFNVDNLGITEEECLRHYLGQLLCRCVEIWEQGEDIDAVKKMFKYLERLFTSELYTGHFTEVPDKLRVLYTLNNMARASFEWHRNHLKKALNIIDYALLRGLETNHDLCSRMGLGIQLALDTFPVLPEVELRHLDTPSRLPTSKIIPVEFNPSFERFLLKYLLPGKPVIIRGMVKYWPCSKIWTFKYLHTLLHNRLMPIEYGSKYTDDDWRQVITYYGDLHTNYILNKNKEVAYMAQHRLLDQVPMLEEHIVLPDYIHMSQVQSRQKHVINCFIGPEGTVSPLHMDPRHNFFCQIRGRKFVRLINPKHEDNLYLFDDPLRSNSSQVDVENPNYELYPKFRDVQCEDFLMEEGDCLFIPRHYYHHIHSLTQSISLSIWFGTQTNPYDP